MNKQSLSLHSLFRGSARITNILTRTFLDINYLILNKTNIHAILINN